MSFTILIPLHQLQYKAIQNIHMGRDVRTDIPPEEAEAFAALKTNLPVIYEYMLNKYPEKFPVGSDIQFEEKNARGVATGKILGTINKLTTSYLGEKARVKAGEVVSESGVVVAPPPPKEAPKVEEVLPLAAVASDTGAVAAPSNAAGGGAVAEVWETLKPYPLFEGEKVVIRTGAPASAKTAEYLNVDYYENQLIKGWKAEFEKGMKNIRFNALVGGNTYESFHPFKMGHKAVWKELWTEITGWLDGIKTFYMANIDPVMKSFGANRVADRGAYRFKYRDYMRPLIDAFEAYILSKYEVVLDKAPAVAAKPKTLSGSDLRAVAELARFVERHPKPEMPSWFEWAVANPPESDYGVEAVGEVDREGDISFDWMIVARGRLMKGDSLIALNGTLEDDVVGQSKAGYYLRYKKKFL